MPEVILPYSLPKAPLPLFNSLCTLEYFMPEVQLPSPTLLNVRDNPNLLHILVHPTLFNAQGTPTLLNAQGILTIFYALGTII